MDELVTSRSKQALIQTARTLAQSKFIERAGYYDEKAIFPAEDFDDLFDAGLMATLISESYGGLGLGHHKGDIYTHWMITKALANADLSLARCWEGHANAMLLIDNIANAEQKSRWFNGVLQQRQIWSAWSGEPQHKKPGKSIGTKLETADGGYLINGSKVFATSASAADWAILLVNTRGPGGARHAAHSPGSVLMLACDLSDPSVTFDDSWWDPIGMKGSVSYRVDFNNTFIPNENLIGKPGQFMTEEWQTRFTPQYATTFLGAAEAAYTFTEEYVKSQAKEQDPYIQHRFGKMALNLETGNLWLRHVARLWESGQDEAAKLAGNKARYLIEQLAMDTVTHAVHACGARSMIKPSRLELIYRDLSFYIRHDNDDHLLSMIGKASLGQHYDGSFFNEVPEKKDQEPVNGKEMQQYNK